MSLSCVPIFHIQTFSVSLIVLVSVIICGYSWLERKKRMKKQSIEESNRQQSSEDWGKKLENHRQKIKAKKRMRRDMSSGIKEQPRKERQLPESLSNIV